MQALKSPAPCRLRRLALIPRQPGRTSFSNNERHEADLDVQTFSRGHVGNTFSSESHGSVLYIEPCLTLYDSFAKQTTFIISRVMEGKLMQLQGSLSGPSL